MVQMNITQFDSIQVEGCDSDLTDLKEYHQRYKICEGHLKTSEVIFLLRTQSD